MKILFITTKNFDYLQDLTFAGLSEILGIDRILDFPNHWQFHSERKNYFSKKNKYPKNIGFSKHSIRKKNSDEQVKKMLSRNEFNYVILASAKPDALLVFQQLISEIKVPWIFIDGGDWPRIGGDFEREGGRDIIDIFESLCQIRRPALIFKRELAVNSKTENVFPLNFSFNSSLIKPLFPNSNKKFQVLFRGVESSTQRTKAFEILAGNYDCNQNGTVKGQKARKYKEIGQKYFETMNQTEISLSFRGVGFDTLRYWEIPASNSLMLSEEPIIQIPDNFRNGKEVVFCKNDLSDLKTLIDYFLKNKNEANEIAQYGQQHLLKFHTHLHRAHYILDIIKKKIKS